MADSVEIKATTRAGTGKGAARSARRDGKVPGVVYGDKGEPEAIAVDHNELFKLMHRGRFMSTVFDLTIDGKKSRVLPRDIQLDPVKDLPIHIDFQRVGPASRVRVSVPVRFVNEALSPGLKRGGVLNIVRREVEVTCPANAIPEFFEFSVEGLEIGRSIHISATRLPDGVRPTILNRDFTVATIAGAPSMKPDEEELAAAAAAAAEGAVEGAEGEPAAEAGAEPGKAPAAPGAKGAAAAPAAKGAEAAKPEEAGRGADRKRK
jgi:large subunit ribosomal protein L25